MTRRRAAGAGLTGWPRRLFLCFALSLAWVGTAFAQEIRLGQAETIHSSILKEDRRLLVSLPAGYGESRERYALVVLLDAEWRFPVASVLAETLADTQVMPKAIIVGIVNTDRDRDLTPALRGDAYGPSGAENFLKFIRDEVIPFAEGRYRTGPYRILLGHSHAGFFTLYTLMRAGDLFDAYISLSPSRGHEEQHVKNLNGFLARQEHLRKFVYVGYGGKESDEIQQGAARFARVLEAHADKGVDAHAERFPFDTHGSVVHKAIGSAFEHLSYWGAAFFPSAGSLLTPEQLQRNAIVERFGYDFRSVPPRPASIARPMLELLNRQQGQSLEAAWRKLHARERDNFNFDPVELANLGSHLHAAGRERDARAVLALLRGTSPGFDPAQAATNNYGKAVDLARGLAAHYPLDGNAVDASGHGHDGKVTGAVPVSDRKGHPGGALAFDGKASFVEIPNGPTLNITGSLAVSAWIKPAKNGMYAAWVAKALRERGPSQWRIGLGANEQQWGLTQFTTDWKDYLLEDHGIAADAWSHVVVCADQTLGTLAYYLNGRRVGAMRKLLGFIPGDGPLLIGAQQDDPAFFSGAVDDVRIYNRVLGEGEVRALWQEGSPG